MSIYLVPAACHPWRAGIALACGIADLYGAPAPAAGYRETPHWAVTGELLAWAPVFRSFRQVLGSGIYIPVLSFLVPSGDRRDQSATSRGGCMAPPSPRRRATGGRPSGATTPLRCVIGRVAVSGRRCGIPLR